MQIKLYPATATALALLMGAAHADSNFANVVQSGSSNSGVVTQGLSSHNGSHNKVGTEVDAAFQDGNNNDLDISQSGSFNEVGTTGKGFDQSGNGDRATITQSSNKNIVGEVQQIDQVKSGSAVRNMLTILQQGVDNNSIDSVRQTRTSGLNGLPGNEATITQGGAGSGGGNHVGTLSQTGRGNSAKVTQSSSDNGLGAMSQKGSQNSARLLQQSGKGNKVGTIDQNGTGNEALLTFTGASNGATSFDPGQLSAFGAFGTLTQGNIRQTGLNNHTGFVVTGDGTAFGLSQNGIGNSVDGVVNGDDNQVGVGQDGTANRAGIQIGAGNKNDVYITQTSGAFSFGNDASVTLAGDRNAVGIAQDGNNNAAAVGINGNANLVTVTQASLPLGNDATIDITGNRNVVSSSQTTGALGRNVLKADIAGNRNELKANQSVSGGGTNLATITFNGSGNYLDVMQSKSGLGGSGNTLNISIYGNRNNDPLLGGFHSSSLSTALGAAAGIVSSFGPGTIYQSGKGNTITLDVGTATADSNRNLFAFVQSGNTNGIVGSINGIGNQAVVVQSGDGNFTSFSQIGNFNVVGVSQ